jgi:hypothetical protein
MGRPAQVEGDELPSLAPKADREDIPSGQFATESAARRRDAPVAPRRSRKCGRDGERDEKSKRDPEHRRHYAAARARGPV